MLENSFFVSLHSSEFLKMFVFNELWQQSSSNQFLLTSQHLGFNAEIQGFSFSPLSHPVPMRRGRERSVKRISQSNSQL